MIQGRFKYIYSVDIEITVNFSYVIQPYWLISNFGKPVVIVSDRSQKLKSCAENKAFGTIWEKSRI